MQKAKKVNKKYDLDAELVYKEMCKFAETKVCSDVLARLFYKLVDNKLDAMSYRNLPPDCKQDMIDCAVMEFIKYGHNFKPKPKDTVGVGVGYIDFNMRNSFNKAIKKHNKQYSRTEVNIELIDIADMQLGWGDEAEDDLT